ncbi:DUF6869 domain-containing protein [Paenirhodobacter populi]|uniref:DUF6869 domain-containing protein n=1 Tax=Paenirhodobacter populi TaxID=2306993 RepID=A0A443J2S3_9RHOB|nr:hypothetical protein [Sinirhodobacter populi]RWR14774.1 hypothetical protein D2T33_02115 [Sinirhodobacter populi]RWR32763.1 hypothetical protein D2T31_02000 [Sinirhodobacter populi]
MTPLPPDLITRLCEAAAPPQDIHTVEALADLWLADHRTDDGDPEEMAWSDLCVFELDAHPEVLWAFVLRALRKAENAWQVGLIAAGPLEDLLMKHGAAVIDRLEEQARRSPRIRYALTGVWTQDIADEGIRQRIDTARIGAVDQGLDLGGPLPPA